MGRFSAFTSPVCAPTSIVRSLLPALFARSPLRAPLFLVLGLQLVEQCVQALERGLPEPAVALQPLRSIGEPLGLEPAGPALGIAAARDQAGTLQHLEMLGDRRLAHRERATELRHRCLARRESREDRATGWIG